MQIESYQRKEHQCGRTKQGSSWDRARKETTQQLKHTRNIQKK